MNADDAENVDFYQPYGAGVPNPASLIETPTTEIICVIDRSGSMASVKNDAIGGFNTFLKAQQDEAEDGSVLLTLVKFNHGYEIAYNGVDIRNVKPLDNKTFVPDGMTALYDAIGRAISDVDEREKSGGATSDRCLMVILTDGEENSSKQYNREKIKEMVEGKKNAGWEFIFLSSELDAWDVGTSFGISAGNIAVYTNSTGGVQDVYNTIGTLAMSYTQTGSISPTWSNTLQTHQPSTSSRKSKAIYNTSMR